MWVFLLRHQGPHTPAAPCCSALSESTNYFCLTASLGAHYCKAARNYPSHFSIFRLRSSVLLLHKWIPQAQGASKKRGSGMGNKESRKKNDRVLGEKEKGRWMRKGKNGRVDRKTKRTDRGTWQVNAWEGAHYRGQITYVTLLPRRGWLIAPVKQLHQRKNPYGLHNAGSNQEKLLPSNLTTEIQ